MRWSTHDVGGSAAVRCWPSLFNAGFDILPADELTADVKGSAILYGPGDDARAAVVAKYCST